MNARPILVTGGASGIGAAVVAALAERGVAAVVLDRNPVEGSHIIADLTDPDAIDHAVAALPERLGGVFHIAGLPGTRPDRDVLAVNLAAPRLLTDAMLDRIEPGGAVVGLSSTVGVGWAARRDELDALLAVEGFDALLDAGQRLVAAGDDAYRLSKQALTLWGRRLAVAALPRGIRVNTVSPGAVQTPILADFYATLDTDLLDGVRERIGRHGTPAEIAAAVLFVGLDATWVNGVDLVVDGGAEALLDEDIPEPRAATASR